MPRADYIHLKIAIALFLLAAIVHLSAGAGPWAFGSEMEFISSLHNSVIYLDRAKYQWAEQHQKSELDTPTLEELMPYLRDRKDGVKRLIGLGIQYRITSLAVPQSDVVTLTRDVRCSAGICRCYPAGSSFSLRTGRTWDRSKCSIAAQLRGFYIDTEYLSVPLLCASGVGSLLIFVRKRMHKKKESVIDS
jgi:hypothetical protein